MRILAFILFAYSSSYATSILPASGPEDILSTSTCVKYACKRVNLVQRKDFESSGQVSAFRFSWASVYIYYAKSRIKGDHYIDFVEINYKYSNSPVISNEICSIIKIFTAESRYIDGKFCKSIASRPVKYGSVQLFRFRPPNSNAIYAFNTINTPESAKVSINRIPPH